MMLEFSSGLYNWLRLLVELFDALKLTLYCVPVGSIWL